MSAWDVGRASADDVRWRDAATLEIEGKGWADTASPFVRLPDSVKDKFSPLAWQLSAESAGICIRFDTDAAAVSLRWSVASESLAMPHMPATGVSGLDLYARDDDGSWRFIGNGRPAKRDGNLARIEFPEGPRRRRECLVYLPLYNGTKSLEIGAPPDAVLEKPAPRPEDRRRPIVVYGTSIVQGGCASRPGMVWTAILGRMLDRPVINLGFSSAGTMQPPVGEALAELDPAAYLIDCTWNMGDGQEVYTERVTRLVRTIRKARPHTPIVFVAQSHIRPETHPTELSRRLEAPVLSLKNEGVEGLFLVPGADLIGSDGEGTVDGVHPNDLGMDRQARCLHPIVDKILGGSTPPRVYIDTDLAAEVDDSFAVYRALIAPEFHVVGLSTIGWEGPLDFPTNTRASQKMSEEMLGLLKLEDRISHPIGAPNPMPAASTPVDSPAARDIIAKAKETPAGQKLQVFVLGCYTNVASALLLDPSITDKLTVHVMGFRYDDERLTPNESNTQGDPHAAAHLLKSGVELKAMVNSTLRHFQWTKADVDAHFKGKGGVRDYLAQRWESYSPNDPQRTLWDIAVFEAVLRPELATLTEVVHDGSRLHVWTQVDIKGMKADYWEAAETLASGSSKPHAAAEASTVKTLDGPSKPHVYIDADTGNEVDDPFAIYRALVAPEFHVVGLSSAGWGETEAFPTNTRTSQRMNEEVLGLLKLEDRISHPIGAPNPMPAASTPVDSPAARDIIARAKAMPAGRKLQVFVLGAYTNVASALLLDPSVTDRMTVHVMGFRYDDERLTPNEFNSQGDLHAAAHLLKSGVELKAMVNTTLDHFQWTKAEVDARFKGKGGLRDYLVQRWESHAPNDPQRILWDIAVFEAVLRPELATLTEVVHDGSRLHVWTQVDVKGMQADYWDATAAPAPVSSKPPASVDPIVISRGEQAHSYQAFPDACRLKNGDILAVFYAGYTHVSLPADDFPLGGRICMVRSSDEGRTWSEPAVLYDDEDDNRDPHVSQLDDGTLICTFFSIAEKDRKRLKTIKDPKLFEQNRSDTGVQIVVSRDDGKTWEAEARSVFPDWVCSAPVRQLPNGVCVLGLYRGDEETGLSIAGTARSTDRGLTWEAPVAIKAPPGVGLNAETDVIRLADGRLYAAMRSFADDMYYAISDDEARSWSEAKKAGFPAHSPHLTRLSSGEIILSHRLPKTSIHISGDDAETWRGPYPIDSCIGAYPATVELKDHSILIIYYVEGGGSVIRARRFNLKPDGIEFLPL
ncbi:SGNH/GDSL hydrolase family protein [Planctomyces sp. SH-PL62]|uniref:SGNH/GDSL hydrolase family protein n=1 Tax=Planctomyces sp. SH-PL62 TaxID=1636152 RepID=UPI0018D3283F|nr:SGNH/GDSL hydrolase family protein [Planctomyces sp. SH-PL62]